MEDSSNHVSVLCKEFNNRCPCCLQQFHDISALDKKYLFSRYICTSFPIKLKPEGLSETQRQSFGTFTNLVCHLVCFVLSYFASLPTLVPRTGNHIVWNFSFFHGLKRYFILSGKIMPQHSRMRIHSTRVKEENKNNTLCSFLIHTRK